jgi:hypothetical protein
MRSDRSLSFNSVRDMRDAARLAARRRYAHSRADRTALREKRCQRRVSTNSVSHSAIYALFELSAARKALRMRSNSPGA